MNLLNDEQNISVLEGETLIGPILRLSGRATESASIVSQTLMKRYYQSANEDSWTAHRHRWRTDDIIYHYIANALWFRQNGISVTWDL